MSNRWVACLASVTCACSAGSTPSVVLVIQDAGHHEPDASLPVYDAGELPDQATPVPDSSPVYDATLDVTTDAPTSEIDSAPDALALDGGHDAALNHVGSVYCATPIGLYVGCDGQSHFDFDLTTPHATCLSNRETIASCVPGDECVVHLTGDGTYHVGVCQ